ncbi:MAG: PEP-CTERM sorting domain-containing protein [Terriglobia bacterium]
MLKGTGWTLALALGLLLVLIPTRGQADQYTIGESSQNVGIVSKGGGLVEVTFGSCAATGPSTLCKLSGLALTPTGSVGSYLLEEIYGGSGPSPITATAGGGGVFNVAMNGATARVSFNGGATWGAVNYTAMADGGLHPTPYGTWQGSPFDFDLQAVNGAGICTLVPACSLNAISLASGASLASPISAGEFVSPGSGPTPEPASLSLFGIGMLALAFLLRRRFKPAR